MDVNFRFLGPDEGGILTEAIEAAYGTTYDVRWVYDPAEVSARLTDGRYVSCAAEANRLPKVVACAATLWLRPAITRSR